VIDTGGFAACGVADQKPFVRDAASGKDLGSHDHA
jgi:hypothetical protein